MPRIRLQRNRRRRLLRRLRYGAAPTATKGVLTSTAPMASTPAFPRIGPHRIVEVRPAPAGASAPASSRYRRCREGNPAKAILTDPQVPESQRFCGNSECNQPVGRGRDGEPGSSGGLLHLSAAPDTRSCPSFLAATSSAGSTRCGAASRTAASAGSTWRSTATCTTAGSCSRVWCNSGDADAMATAAAEALALAEVEHPNIVRIHNFVEHKDSAGTTVGYIVMEYVGGTSLKQIRKAHNGPLPPDQAVAYIVEIAPALGYLHEEGLAYCDFKPDNVMQSDEQLKLIDLGATVAMDDDDAVIYGTRGYQAPEIAWTGPTVATDIYTVGRTLAVLVMDFPQENGRFAEQLPDPRPCRCSRSTSRCTAPSFAPPTPIPQRRFASMDELADQLTGVLHEIAAADSGHPQPRISTHFSPQRAIYGAGWDVPLSVGVGDRGARRAQGRRRTIPAQRCWPRRAAPRPPNWSRRSSMPSAVEQPPQQLRRGAAATGPRFAGARRRQGRPHAARRTRIGDSRRLAADSGTAGSALCWRAISTRPQPHFDAVLTMLPGELDPKLALAATAELRGAHDEATRYYETVWRTNHTLLQCGVRPGAPASAGG